jgi:hypothetical protein
MKFLIWAIAVIISATIKVFLEHATGGPVPLPVAFIITIPVFFIAPALCKKYDEYKKVKATKEKENTTEDEPIEK